MTVRRIFTLMGLCLAACGQPQPTPPATTPTPVPAATDTPRPIAPPPPIEAPRPTVTDGPPIQRDGFWTLADAPSPTACVTDADCIGDTVPAEDLCCQDPHTLTAHARAWREHIRLYRTRACSGHVCPPPPAPAQPPSCAFEVRCEAGRCMESCP
jgi:hypothetical protein